MEELKEQIKKEVKASLTLNSKIRKTIKEGEPGATKELHYNFLNLKLATDIIEKIKILEEEEKDNKIEVVLSKEVEQYVK